MESIIAQMKALGERNRLRAFLALTGHRYLIYPDSMEYAQTARNLSQGMGAVTDTIWVLRTAYPFTRLPSDVRRPLPWSAVVLVFALGGMMTGWWSRIYGDA